MTVNAQALFDEKDYTGTYPYVADHVIQRRNVLPRHSGPLRRR